jgi:hypothetical protein
MTVHPRYTIRTLVVDDHQVVCQRFHGFLNGKSDRGPSARRLRPPGLDERVWVAVQQGRSATMIRVVCRMPPSLSLYG